VTMRNAPPEGTGRFGIAKVLLFVKRFFHLKIG
jgi:hypothetical protein